MHAARPWLLASALAAGCISPEADRGRGGGPGADSQNRPAIVEMHGGSQQYWETPVLIPAEAEAPSLEPARHAQTTSGAR